MGRPCFTAGGPKQGLITVPIFPTAPIPRMPFLAFQGPSSQKRRNQSCDCPLLRSYIKCMDTPVAARAISNTVIIIVITIPTCTAACDLPSSPGEYVVWDYCLHLTDAQTELQRLWLGQDHTKRAIPCSRGSTEMSGTRAGRTVLGTGAVSWGWDSGVAGFLCCADLPRGEERVNCQSCSRRAGCLWFVWFIWVKAPSEGVDTGSQVEGREVSLSPPGPSLGILEGQARLRLGRWLRLD